MAIHYIAFAERERESGRVSSCSSEEANLGAVCEMFWQSSLFSNATPLTSFKYGISCYTIFEKLEIHAYMLLSLGARELGDVDGQL